MNAAAPLPAQPGPDDTAGAAYFPVRVGRGGRELRGLLGAVIRGVVCSDCWSAYQLLRLLVGALFARGRRTVPSWSRAAGIGTDFRRAYSALWTAGRRAEGLARRLHGCALLPLMGQGPGGHLLFILDDTPIPLYGPCVQGAGAHHNPTPGPAGEKFLYRHVWVTLARLARHPPLGHPGPAPGPRRAGGGRAGGGHAAGQEEEVPPFRRRPP